LPEKSYRGTYRREQDTNGRKCETAQARMQFIDEGQRIWHGSFSGVEKKEGREMDVEAEGGTRMAKP
jgi:hypothetical protein